MVSTSTVDGDDDRLAGQIRSLPELRSGPLRLPERVGGALCLDFANTVDNRLGDRPRDRFGSYDDILTWAVYADVLAPDEATRLWSIAEAAPAAGEAAFRRARLLREVI